MKRLLLALLLSAPVIGSAQDAASKDPFTGGDPAAGATKGAPCVACHGPAGNSGMPEWPKLAGQGSVYLAKQLKYFKSGERKNPIMAGQVAALSEQDFKDLAAYFTQQKGSPGVASKDAVALAEPLVRAGDAARGIPACAGCHGPKGSGNPAAGYPRLSGQHAKYTATQLYLFRDKPAERAVGASGQMMAAVAAKLTDQEIEALASYFNGLQ